MFSFVTVCLDMEKGVASICWLLLLLCAVTNRVNSEWEDFDFSKYHHYDDIQSLFAHYSELFPDIAQVGSIGKSENGRDLSYIRISDNASIAEQGEPKFKYVANIHGNEAIGRELVVYLTQYLLENYGADQRVTNLVDNTDIYLMPSANPDGFESARLGIVTGNYDTDSCLGVQGRQNAKNVDLNRNFPDQFRNKSNDPIQKETQALINWIEENNFVLSANLHGGSVVASYPYDDSKRHIEEGVYSKAPDDNVFK